MGVMHQNRRNTILLGQDNNALTWLIIINSVIFVIIYILKIGYFLTYDTNIEATQNFQMQILNWFTLPGSFDKFITKPWTILTYMVSHDSIWQLIGTLLWLWGFGYILQDLTANSKLIPLYLYGGFAGGVVFILVSGLMPQSNETVLSSGTFLGGTAAVMSVAIASTTLAPRYKIFPMINGGIPLWILTLIFVAIDYVTTPGLNYAIAHLAGGIIGFIFIKQMQQGSDWGEWMNSFVNWLNDLFNPEKKYRKKKPSQQNFYRAVRKPYEKTPHITQQKLDEILDKINQEGYHSLSDEEKDFLKKASQEDI